MRYLALACDYDGTLAAEGLVASETPAGARAPAGVGAPTPLGDRSSRHAARRRCCWGNTHG
jgi:hypothetical protein